MSDITPDLDIPQVFKRHVFMCLQQRPPGHPRGSCGGAGAAPLWEYLSAKLEVMNHVDLGRTPAGCFGFCQAGPVMVVYPEGVWYAPRTTEDLDEILAEHLVNGRLVERLAFVPRP